MNYYSLNKISASATFEEATVKGQAPDKGLYFPESIPALSKDFITNIQSYSKEEIGFTVMKPFVGGSIPDDVLQHIVNETINFDFPLVKVSDTIYSLELFHGPTLAFKDVGARFMSRCLGYFNRNKNQKTTVLVATSGDTGGAVANGFLGVEGVDVIILYPSKKVSPVQELQLTTLGKNITAIEITGSFDDCQSIVKQAFADAELNNKYSLTSANSINVARWLPQQLYYFYAYQQWQQEKPPIISVPSGNFGNICAGILANISGLPVKHFIAACNANDVVPEFLKTGNYQPKQSIATISNAMDVGNPSNFIRILELFHQKTDDLKSQLSSVSIDDVTTEETIKDIFKKYNYVLDPHGAVAYYALKEYMEWDNNEFDNSTLPKPAGIFLETAHPVKFPEIVEAVTAQKIEAPESVEYLFDRKKLSIEMQPSFAAFKEWMMSKNV
ncbi:threonine synthase [Parafilimonas terrae]|uniref:Threonine synthase n=1 Tax=Parafilimonas terrae TaxID=1465490 RepID=A0A1I5YZV2_9BACT|nr:threonine synthase [Parafilimonas terrae]SFQ49719.1 threonine synthase [Parafilimonas terrae]